MLRDVSLAEFDSTSRLFGRNYKTPLVIAPIGVQAQLHAEEADCATAKAAADLEIPFTLSSATSRPMEQVYEHAGFRTNPAEDDDDGVDAWFQLYWPQDDELTESLLKRAKKAGYRVLVVTLDTWNLGWRPRDLDTAYNPFLTGEGVANVFTDPVFIEKYCDGKVSPSICSRFFVGTTADQGICHDFLPRRTRDDLMSPRTRSHLHPLQRSRSSRLASPANGQTWPICANCGGTILSPSKASKLSPMLPELSKQAWMACLSRITEVGRSMAPCPPSTSWKRSQATSIRYRSRKAKKRRR